MWHSRGTSSKFKDTTVSTRTEPKVPGMLKPRGTGEDRGLGESDLVRLISGGVTLGKDGTKSCAANR
jgi:hypothetical protein